MRFLPWAMLMVAGTLAGVVTCASFVVRRSRIVVAALAGSGVGVLLALAVTAIWTQTRRVDTSIASLFITLGAMAGGYALAAAILPSLTRHRPTAPTLDTVADVDSLGVILLADAEPERYNAADVTRDLDSFERGDVPLPPYVARPLFYASERARYRAAGGSPARRAVTGVAAALTKRLAEENVADVVEVAYCTGGPSAAEAAVRLAERSGRRVVIAALTVARTPAFDAAATAVHALDPSRSRLDVEMTEPLWASHVVAVRAAERALAGFGDSGIADGVVLVARGNPWQLDRLFPDAMEQTTFLAQRIRAELIESGLPAERVRQAWIEWEEPDVREAVRHLAALGARQVCLLPVDMLHESLATAVDLPMAAERAAVESGVHVTLVAPLGDDPALIGALRHAIVEATYRLGSRDGQAR